MPTLKGLLLRSVSCAGVLTLDEVKKLISNNSDGETPDLQELISEINNTIKPFKQTLKIVSDELTGSQFLVFLNLASDDATKAQNFFTPLELEYFRLLIEEIMLAEKRQITGMYAMNLVGKMKGAFPKASAQKLLGTWCQMRYLDKSGNEYALGIRAIHEFESYLRQNMADAIEECCLCKQIVFRGGNCPSCGSATHTRCLQQYIQRVPKWPCCKIPYNPDITQNEPSQSSMESEQYGESELQVTQNDTSLEDTQQCSMEEDISQLSAPEISQSVARKRKRAVYD